MSKPKPPPAPVLPQQYSPEVVDQSALDARSQDRRRQVARAGRQTTILSGQSRGGAGMPPTSGAKMLLGN